MPDDKKAIDLENLTAEEKENIDVLIKKLIDREKLRLDDITAHANDHRSSHTSAPT